MVVCLDLPILFLAVSSHLICVNFRRWTTNKYKWSMFNAELVGIGGGCQALRLTASHDL